MTEFPDNTYGTTPYTPQEYTNLGEEPRSAKLTKSLVWPLLVLNLLSSILGLMAMRAVGAAEYLRPSLPPEEFQNMDQAMLDTLFSATTVFAIIFAVISVVLFIIVGLGLRANKNWARFTGLVLGAFYLLSALYTLVLATPYGELGGFELVNSILTWVIVLVTIWWFIQALQKDTNRWFAMHRALQG